MPTAQQFLTDPTAVTTWLMDHCNVYGSATVAEDGVVSVEGSVVIKNTALNGLNTFGIQFGTVTGDFDCSHCANLKSLKGSPQRVGGNFSCNNCYNLPRLAGAPRSVGGFFDCRFCWCITSTRGISSHIGSHLDCSIGVKLVDLTDLPPLPEGLLTSDLRKQTAEVVRKLIQNKTELKTPMKSKWISIVNDYHASGDLLTAIAQFEKYYKVPFTVEPAPYTVEKILLDGPLC